MPRAHPTRSPTREQPGTSTLWLPLWLPCWAESWALGCWATALERCGGWSVAAGNCRRQRRERVGRRGRAWWAHSAAVGGEHRQVAVEAPPPIPPATPQPTDQTHPDRRSLPGRTPRPALSWKAHDREEGS